MDELCSCAHEPIRPETNETIYYRSVDDPWKTLDIVKTNASCGYTTTWLVTETGIFQVEASWQGDLRYLPSESSVETISFEARPIDVLYIAIAILILIALTAGIITHYNKIKKMNR